MDVPLKKYSSGMHLRLGFSIAAHLDPEILLLDEIFAVGDQDFQKQCMKTMQQFLADGRTLLFVSHAAVAVRAMCRRVCVLDRGQLLFDGGVEEGLAHYDWLINRPERERAAQVSAQRSPADGGNTLADWRERTGEWALAVLRAGGLQPHHRVLEVTCGAGTGSAALAAYVGAGNYRHWEVNWPGGDPLGPFDYAIASPLLARISLNTAARCLALLVRTMNENGRIYASWMDHAEAIDVSDVSPFEYPFALVAGVGDALGLRASRVDAASHPAGESVLVFERR
jgi:broad specificity phosphatase PhoE